jgi:hypothetical protein
MIKTVEREKERGLFSYHNKISFRDPPFLQIQILMIEHI